MSITKATLRAALAGALIVGWVNLGGSALADDEAARELYLKTCSKCHGRVAGDVSLRPEDLLVYVVTMPLGPPLRNVYGRPAGSFGTYPYSEAMKEIATGWKWDEEALDLWFTSSQDMIRGSTMFLKMKKAEERKTIIDYLKKYAPYEG
ncbi:MAG: c-type cytochrome [Alphaproteobacteria bacterium]|nr:c-type cytochrome [Alphaproteobacteria bacterium]